MSKGAKQPKVVNNETAVSAWISSNFVKQLYACIKDISADWVDVQPFPENRFESYDNLIRSKDDRADVTKLFTIGAEFKKLVYVLLTHFMSEANEANDVVQSDTVDTILEKLRSNGGGELIAVMVKIVAAYKCRWGETLTSSIQESDKSFGEIMYNLFPPEWKKFGTKFNGELSDFFADFIGCVAYFLAVPKWYTERPICHNEIIAHLHMFGLPRSHLDDIRGDAFVAKKPAKPRKPKKADEAGAADSTTAAAPPADSPAPAANESDIGAALAALTSPKST